MDYVSFCRAHLTYNSAYSVVDREGPKGVLGPAPQDLVTADGDVLAEHGRGAAPHGLQP
jgi:hypothetical protein